MQVKGRHQLKYGYRWVWRQPSPLTHTDTRSTLTLGRNFVNNPVNNTGGTGLATLLLGFVNSGSRGFLMEPYVLDVHEHGAFIQDDFKLKSNVTVNAGLRYEIFTPGVERDNKIVNYDPVNKVFDYAGENGTTRAANKKTQNGNLAPRLGIVWRAVPRTTCGPAGAGRLRPNAVPAVASSILFLPFSASSIER